MIRTILAAAFLLVGLAFSASAADQNPPRPLQACAEQAPYGWPQTNRPNTTPICRMAYALLHDNGAKIASWVVYTLAPTNTTGCEPRINAFAPDQSLPRGMRSELSDYAGSGYDTGHIANNADMSWNPVAARESFILSNMAPQLPSLNRGLWRQLESYTRAWAYNRNSNLTIYAGSIYDLNQDRRIGSSKVVVPRGFYKIIVDNTSGEHLAFVFPHRDGLGNNLRAVQSTVSQIETYTGISFPLPGNKTVASPLWPINLAPVTAAKKQRCGRD